MKKKIQKSLNLNRETLTSLCHSDLREAAGAAFSQLANCTANCTGAACATAVTCAVIRTQCVGY